MRPLLVVVASLITGTSAAAQVTSPPMPAFDVTETTIADIHAAMRARTLTCRELVSAHGGRVWAEARQGPGSRFVVELPSGRAPGA